MYADNFSFKMVKYECFLPGMSMVLQDTANAFIIEIFTSHIISSPLGPFEDAK